MMSIQPTIHHHPTVEQLIEFTAGTQSLSHALCVATHLESCPHCQQQRLKLQAIGSLQLQELPTNTVPATIKKRVLSRLKLSRDEAQLKSDSVPSDIPRPLQKLIPKGFDELMWKKITRDVSLCELMKEPNGTQIALVNVKAGGNMAHHSHTHDEITVILKGSFSDEDGIYQQGDYLLRNSGHKHKPIATNDQNCICLIVLDGPIQLTGFFSPLLNPLLRLNHRLT